MKTGCPPCGHQCEGGRDTLIRKTLHCCCQHSATAKSYMMIAFDDHSQWIWVWTNSGRQWRTGKPVCYGPKDLKELDKTERRNNSWVNKKILFLLPHILKMRSLETETVPSHVLGYQAPAKKDGESSLLIHGCSTQSTLEGKLGREKEAVLFRTHYSRGLKVRMEFRKTQTMNNFHCKNNA